MNTEARVGAFILAGLLLLGGMILKLGDVSLKRQYTLRVVFADVAGLPDKSVVKLSGVEVGKVKKISLEGDKAVVDIGVYREIEIYRDAQFRIGSTSIIGSKFLQVDQGKAAAGKLKPGETVEGEVSVPLERLMANALKSVQGILDNMDASLGKEGALMSNLTESTKNMRELTANMNDLLADVKPALTRSLERSDDVMIKLDELLAQANELTAKLNSSTGTVGALLSDPEMKDDVKVSIDNLREASASAKDALGRINSFKFYWQATGRHEPEARATKGDIGLRIEPRVGKFYFLGASNLGSTDNTPQRYDYEEKNTINAVIGFYGKWWEVFGGALRSSFGVGGKLYPFPEVPLLKRFNFFAQAYDLGRNRTVLGRDLDQPVYDAGAEFRVHKWVTLGARVADLAEAQRFQGTANLSFEDKDIAYFFGLVSLSGGSKK